MNAEERKDYARELGSYLVGLGLALLLSLVPFAVVSSGAVSATQSLWVIAVLALIQIVVHFRCFLHIDFSKQKREDLQLILFSVLLLVIMSGGTIYIMHNLDARMM